MPYLVVFGHILPLDILSCPYISIIVYLYISVLMVTPVTTLRISDDINRKLEEFLALLLLRKGVKVDKKTFVEKAILWAMQSEDFLREITGDVVPLEEDPAWILLDKPKRWGVEDSSTRIDEYLYG